MTATAEQLRDVRKRLARAMGVKSGGFRYESVFGCDDRVKHYTPYVSVLVRLEHSRDSDLGHFEVLVDFHLPLGASVDQADHFKKATIAAVKKAKWAESVVGGLEWDLDAVVGEEVE